MERTNRILMPANYTKAYWVCETRRHFETEVESSSSDKTYTVKYGPRVEGKHHYSWSCDCPSYQYGTGTDDKGHCKHIQQVRESGEYCGWDGFFDAGEPEKDENGDRKCPQCGSDVFAEERKV